ncbi:MAG: hypothetical protein ABIV39_11760, partial [Verrucomicrobiota bacterium]
MRQPKKERAEQEKRWREIAARRAAAEATMSQSHLITSLSKTFLAFVLGLLVVMTPSFAADWPQFRGPNRDGRWDESGILETFPREGVNIRWRHPVGGGFASP